MKIPEVVGSVEVSSHHELSASQPKLNPEKPGRATMSARTASGSWYGKSAVKK